MKRPDDYKKTNIKVRKTSLRHSDNVQGLFPTFPTCYTMCNKKFNIPGTS